MAADPLTFSGALDQVLDDLARGNPFALVRFNDGEYRVCNGQKYTAVDGWAAPAKAWFQEALLQSLRYAAPRYRIGVSAPCCGGPRMAAWYSKQITGEQTYGTIFNNANWSRAREELSKVDALWLGSSESADIKIPADCLSSQWNYAHLVDQLVRATKPVLLSAGPLANILIYKVWKRRKDIALVDVGSVFDGEVLRAYQDPAAGLQHHECRWVWKGTSPPAKVMAPVVGVKRPGGVKALKQRQQDRRAKRRGA